MTKEHKGLSPSSFTEYLSCGKKYYYRKIAKLPPDKDYVDDVAVFNVGKAFHKLCEDSLHEIDKVTDQHIAGVLELYQLDVKEFLDMMRVMLDAYWVTHKKSGLKVLACEVEIETHSFFGIVDVVLGDDTGDWWIGDLKTASSFVESQIPNLFSHPQLNLYAAHSPKLARTLGLDIKKFKGCRYRVTTKSKMKRKEDETDTKYRRRLSESVRSVDVVLPIDRMIYRNVYEAHQQVSAELSKGEKGYYPRNYSNCFAYYKPCQFWSQCNNGRLYSEVKEVELLSNVGP